MSGPTVYARLMDAALKEPRDTIEQEIELFIRGSGLNILSARVSEMLKEAYIAGVRDGFANAVMSEGGDRDS